MPALMTTKSVAWPRFLLPALRQVGCLPRVVSFNLFCGFLHLKRRYRCSVNEIITIPDHPPGRSPLCLSGSNVFSSDGSSLSEFSLFL